MSTPVIEINRLTRDYGNGKGVFDVSISVDKGECFGYLGPNGAGKTTTIRHLMGFCNPDSGTLKINGFDCRKQAARLMGNVGYLPGELAFPKGITGEQFLEMQLSMHRVSDRSFCDSLVRHFEIELKPKLEDMSLGMRRKIAVAAAFLHDPEILILDEPTSGLDPVMQEVFIEFIQSEKKRGRTILLSSHIFHEVDACCDRIAIIRDGRIVSEFRSGELRSSSDSIYEVTFASGKKITTSVSSTHLTDWMKELSLSDVVDVQEIPFSLEQYFMQFYKEDLTYGEVH